ncbi:hypothetical protein HY090_00990 [Candidatus Kaiserbacteria bacterium]|nr:hypothetical protein [Candidatus Kaiserbacteria bacterium]
MKHAYTHEDEKKKLIPHAWGFGESHTFMNNFTWPEFDFDLEEEAAEERKNDKTLERMTTHLSSRKSTG